jgi:hypothetical protein
MLRLFIFSRVSGTLLKKHLDIYLLSISHSQHVHACGEGLFRHAICLTVALKRSCIVFRIMLSTQAGRWRIHGGQK